MRLDIQLYIATTLSCVLALFCLYTAIPFVLILRAVIFAIFSNIAWRYIVPAFVTSSLAIILFITYKNKPAKCLGIAISVAMTVLSRYHRLRMLFAFQRMKRAFQDLENAQKKVLKEILDHASCTAYYTENDLDQIKHRDQFRSHHPLTTYEHYRKWIDRIIDGEDKVLIAEKVDFLVATTGTTSGKSKFFPKSVLYMSRLYIKEVVHFAFMHQVPGTMNAKPVLDVGFKSKIRTTKKGLKIGAMSALFNNQFGRLSATPFVLKSIADLPTSTYLQALFALKNKEIGIMSMGFGSHAYTFFKLVEDRWPELCADIRRGQINNTVRASIPPYIRDQLSAKLLPDPQRADELEGEFSKGIQDFVPRIWPCASIIFAFVTGPFAIYKTIMKEKYVASVPIFTGFHGSSESMYGVNIWPGRDKEEFLMLPTTAFFEYIEQDDSGSGEERCVLAHQVEIGKHYEIVVTTYEGLYRYRSNDVIKVTGFYDQAPVYKFIQRADDNLSVYAEKTPVFEVTEILNAAAQHWDNCDVIDYTTTESINLRHVIGESETMGYMIIVEISGERPREEQIRQLDNELRQRVQAYDIYRESARIAPVNVLYTTSGAFSRLREYKLRNNADASFNQFKVPRLIRKQEYLTCLLSDTHI